MRLKQFFSGGPAYLIAILSLASLLFLTNLSNQCLWQDEAQTALISKTILAHGVPLGYDGRNHYSQELGAEYGDNYVYKWHTWFSFYAVAASFALFGTNTLAARIPSALFGIGTVILLYFFSKSLWHSKTAGVAASLGLLFSVPFLILSRQARYYSATAFFSLLGLYAYNRILNRKKHAYPLFVMAATLLFHTHYIYCATLLATVAIHTLVCHRSLWKGILVLSGLVVVINLPWIVWLSGMKYFDAYGARLFDMGQFLLSAKTHLGHLKTHVFPPALLLVALVVCALSRKRRDPARRKTPEIWKRVVLLCLFLVFNLVALSLTNPAPFFRYLTPLLPAAFALIGAIVANAVNVHILAGLLIMVLLILTNPIRDFLYELTHDYDGPIEGIVRYLNEHGAQDDVVAITYGDLPVKFYTGMRVVGGLTGEDLAPAKEADWIILRRNIICEKDYAVAEYLINNVPMDMYHLTEIDYPDIPFENREDPSLHRFRTATDTPKVRIFRRMESNGQSRNAQTK